ncbi:hypothetical protein niasHS_014278 [Heterodera schachtii]|uniref:Uncharacterized protein n=1 Tax=Heterodera schachtii TaxID=97005 RepID=A0ABD2I6T3_HETSC
MFAQRGQPKQHNTSSSSRKPTMQSTNPIYFGTFVSNFETVVPRCVCHILLPLGVPFVQRGIRRCLPPPPAPRLSNRFSYFKKGVRHCRRGAVQQRPSGVKSGECLCCLSRSRVSRASSSVESVCVCVRACVL